MLPRNFAQHVSTTGRLVCCICLALSSCREPVLQHGGFSAKTTLIAVVLTPLQPTSDIYRMGTHGNSSHTTEIRRRAKQVCRFHAQISAAMVRQAGLVIVFEGAEDRYSRPEGRSAPNCIA